MVRSQSVRVHVLRWGLRLVGTVGKVYVFTSIVMDTTKTETYVCVVHTRLGISKIRWMDDDGLCEDGRVERVAFNERLLKTGKKGSRNR